MLLISRCFQQQYNFCCACFPGLSRTYRAMCWYYPDMSVHIDMPRLGVATCWGSAGLTASVSRNKCHRSKTIAISCDMGD